MRRKTFRSVKPSQAGFSRVTALESERGFCVKAVRKPDDCILPRPVWEPSQGGRPVGRNIRTIGDWSSSQNNNNNAWNQNFNNGNQNDNNKNNTNSVRAVRGFTQKQNRGNLPENNVFSGGPFFMADGYAA